MGSESERRSRRSDLVLQRNTSLIPDSHYHYLEALLGLCSSLYQRYYLFKFGHADYLKNLRLYLDLQRDVLDRQPLLLAPVEVQLFLPSPVLDVTSMARSSAFEFASGFYNNVLFPALGKAADADPKLVFGPIEQAMSEKEQNSRKTTLVVSPKVSRHENVRKKTAKVIMIILGLLWTLLSLLLSLQTAVDGVWRTKETISLALGKTSNAKTFNKAGTIGRL